MTCMTVELDTLGIEPKASRMLSGCDTATPCAHEIIHRNYVGALLMAGCDLSLSEIIAQGEPLSNFLSAT